MEELAQVNVKVLPARDAGEPRPADEAVDVGVVGPHPQIEVPGAGIHAARAEAVAVEDEPARVGVGACVETSIQGLVVRAVGGVAVAGCRSGYIHHRERPLRLPRLALHLKQFAIRQPNCRKLSTVEGAGIHPDLVGLNEWLRQAIVPKHHWFAPIIGAF